MKNLRELIEKCACILHTLAKDVRHEYMHATGFIRMPRHNPHQSRFEPVGLIKYDSSQNTLKPQGRNAETLSSHLHDAQRHTIHYAWWMTMPITKVKVILYGKARAQ